MFVLTLLNWCPWFFIAQKHVARIRWTVLSVDLNFFMLLQHWKKIHAPTALKILRVVATHGRKFELLYSIENFKTHLATYGQKFWGFRSDAWASTTNERKMNIWTCSIIFHSKTTTPNRAWILVSTLFPISLHEPNKKIWTKNQLPILIPSFNSHH